MRMLHIISSVDPKGGGPMEGVHQISVKLIEMGHAVEVLSLDDPQAPYLQACPLKVHSLGPSHGAYQYNTRLVGWLQAHAKAYDAIVVNGLWQYHSFGTWRALRRLGVPYYLYAHGMLDPWFKRAYPLKHLKKWLYWPWAEYRVLRDAAAVLFTCEDERVLARQSFWLYRAREAVVSFGTKAAPTNAAELRSGFLQKYPALQGKRVLLFLGRIQHKKGCDLLIDAFANVAQQHPDLHLLMAGPDQTGWVAPLQALAEVRGVADRISWPGMLQGDLKWGAFYSAEAFVLPSHQENFGIAVAEAMGCDLPVLISDKVNIWREIQADGAGIVNTDSAEGTLRTLQQWLELSALEKKAMGQNAKRSFDTRFTVDAMASSLLDVVSKGHT